MKSLPMNLLDFSKTDVDNYPKWFLSLIKYSKMSFLMAVSTAAWPLPSTTHISCVCNILCSCLALDHVPEQYKPHSQNLQGLFFVSEYILKV